MVMDRFGKDLQKIFEEKGKQFTRKTVLQLGLRIVSKREKNPVFLLLVSIISFVFLVKFIKG